MILLPVTHPDVSQAFKHLPGGALAANGGEVWQYMGTEEAFGAVDPATNRPACAGYVHNFRHRNHPLVGGKVYRYQWANVTQWEIDNHTY